MASRKQFNGFAHGLASRFISRYNDIGGYWGIGVLALDLPLAGTSVLEFDILSEQGDQGTAAWLMNLLTATGTPREWLVAANLRLEYTPRADDPSEKLWPVWVDKPQGADLYRVVATATLEDDRGRRFDASAQTWCWAHEPKREHRSSRSVWRSVVGPNAIAGSPDL